MGVSQGAGVLSFRDQGVFGAELLGSKRLERRSTQPKTKNKYTQTQPKRYYHSGTMNNVRLSVPEFSPRAGLLAHVDRRLGLVGQGRPLRTRGPESRAGGASRKQHLQNEQRRRVGSRAGSVLNYRAVHRHLSTARVPSLQWIPCLRQADDPAARGAHRGGSARLPRHLLPRRLTRRARVLDRAVNGIFR